MRMRTHMWMFKQVAAKDFGEDLEEDEAVIEDD